MKKLWAALAACGVFCIQAHLLAAPAGPPRAGARITFANGSFVDLRADDRFQLIGVLAGETITINLQLPPSFANTLVAVQALDGGLVSGDMTIGVDGMGALAFQAGVQPGVYRILFSALGRSALLRFSVPNPANP